MHQLSQTAYAALTDPFLLDLIVSFQRGLPYDLAPLARHPKMWLCKTLPLVASRLPNALWYLERLHRLALKQPQYANERSDLSFDGVWGDAIKRERLLVALWIDRQPGLRFSDPAGGTWNHILSLSTRVLPWAAIDAAANRHQEILEYVLEHTSWRYEDLIVAAAMNGNVEAVRFLHENYHQHCTPNALYQAANRGRIDVLAYLLAHCSVSSPKLLLWAVYGGKIAVVQFVLDHCPEQCLIEAHNFAVSCNYPEIALFLAATVPRESLSKRRVTVRSTEFCEDE